jgi:hypothetical protein
MPLPAGSRLGPYEVLAPLGAGGMGEVYRARDTRLERTVAIKVLPAMLAGDPEFRARFEREAKSISALSHPHICTLYDVGEAPASAPVPGASVAYPEALRSRHLGGRRDRPRVSRGRRRVVAQACVHGHECPGQVFVRPAGWHRVLARRPPEFRGVTRRDDDRVHRQRADLRPPHGRTRRPAHPRFTGRSPRPRPFAGQSVDRVFRAVLDPRRPDAYPLGEPRRP